MSASVDPWTGPGSGSNNDAPNTHQWQADAASQSVTVRFRFFNSSGVLVTVDASVSVFDETSQTVLGTQTGTGVNTLSRTDTMTSGHTCTGRVTYNNGTSCDHCIMDITSIGASTSNHPIFKVRRSGAWVNVGGNLIRIRRAGAWVPVNGGIFVRRTGAWKQP